MWPSKLMEPVIPAQKVNKGDMLISDDLPNLQEIFMKNKNSISVSNRRVQRQKNDGNLKTSQTETLIDPQTQAKFNLNKSPSPYDMQLLEVPSTFADNESMQ